MPQMSQLGEQTPSERRYGALCFNASIMLGCCTTLHGSMEMTNTASSTVRSSSLMPCQSTLSICRHVDLKLISSDIISYNNNDAYYSMMILH